MSSLLGAGAAAQPGATPPTAGGLLSATSEGSSGGLFASTSTGGSIFGRPPAAAGLGELPGVSSKNAASSNGNNVDGRVSLFGASAGSSGNLSSGLFQGTVEGGNKAGGTGLTAGSLFGSGGDSVGGSGGVTSTLQGVFGSKLPTSGGGLFGAAGSKPFSLFSTVSAPSGTASAAGSGGSAPVLPSSAAGSEQQLFSNLSTTPPSGLTSSLFGTAKSAETAQTAGSAKITTTNHGGSDSAGSAKAAASNVTAIHSQAGNLFSSPIGNPQLSEVSSATSSAAVASHTAAPSGGLFGSSASRVIPTLNTSDSTQAAGGGGINASGSGAPVHGTSETLGSAGTNLFSTGLSRSAGSNNGALAEKSGVSSVTSSAAAGMKSGERTLMASSNFGAGARSSGPCDTSGILPAPREAALETLQHELLEEVLAKWERRLERRVEQFVTVAEDVGSVEKAMIEESRKIQQLMNEQAKLERKQVYTAGMVDSLEDQQQSLMTLLRSIESAVLELRSGGAESSFVGKDSLATPSDFVGGGATAGSSDAGAWFGLLRGAHGESDGGSGKPGLDACASLGASAPLLFSAEQLALERLKNLDQQLAEVGQNLSYTAETFTTGPLGAVAQVLAVHQAALRTAAQQAAHIEEQMHELQEVWGIGSATPSSSANAFAKQSDGAPVMGRSGAFAS